MIELVFPPHMARHEISETINARPDEHGFVLEGSPFYVEDLSYQDTVSAEMVDGRWMFREIVRRGGHSTYRILVDRENEEKFSLRWPQLKALGCTYERGGREELPLYAVNIPPGADMSAVYAVMQAGEDADDWMFEEAHLYSDT